MDPTPLPFQTNPWGNHLAGIGTMAREAKRTYKAQPQSNHHVIAGCLPHATALPLVWRTSVADADFVVARDV